MTHPCQHTTSAPFWQPHCSPSPLGSASQCRPHSLGTVSPFPAPLLPQTRQTLPRTLQLASSPRPLLHSRNLCRHLQTAPLKPYRHCHSPRQPQQQPGQPGHDVDQQPSCSATHHHRRHHHLDFHLQTATLHQRQPQQLHRQLQTATLHPHRHHHSNRHQRQQQTG